MLNGNIEVAAVVENSFINVSRRAVTSGRIEYGRSISELRRCHNDVVKLLVGFGPEEAGNERTWTGAQRSVDTKNGGG
jgi:hypothetical protein